LDIDRGRNVERQLDYGNWVQKRKLLILGLLALGMGAMLFIPAAGFYRLIIAIVFSTALVSFLLPLCAYVSFSQRGGKFQEKVYNLIIQSLGEQVTGKILDIGSGNGVLAARIAQCHPRSEVVGIDFWGKDWEYSQSACEKNARAAHVEDRVHFQRGNAAELEFPNETFDGVVSNLTFHEVKFVADKRMLVQEALRVVKPGGAFAFVDYFYDEKLYGKATEFDEYLKDLKLAQFACVPLHNAMAIPLLLRYPKLLGKAGLICGKK
jgi:ubiquinone/menaquinone biosynthesis C-methylase UbiE